MHGWVDRSMDGQMAGWKERAGTMDGQTHRWTDRHTEDREIIIAITISHFFYGDTQIISIFQS